MARRIGPLRDGDPDPLGDDSDPGSLTIRRRRAIADVVKLMGCHHPRNVNCDCVDAIARLAAVMNESACDVLLAGIQELPRPLSYRDIVALANTMHLQTWISTSEARR